MNNCALERFISLSIMVICMAIWGGVPYKEVVRHCIGISLEKMGGNGNLEDIADNTKLDCKPIPINDIKNGISYLIRKRIILLSSNHYFFNEGYSSSDCLG